MEKATFVAATEYGEFRRTSCREYLFCIARKDGWHQFSQSSQAVERERRYQENRGKSVVVVPVIRLAAE